MVHSQTHSNIAAVGRLGLPFCSCSVFLRGDLTLSWSPFSPGTLHRLRKFWDTYQALFFCRALETWILFFLASGLQNARKSDWIGLRENLQETIDFPIKYGAFLQIFPSSNSMRNPTTNLKTMSFTSPVIGLALPRLHFWWKAHFWRVTRVMPGAPLWLGGQDLEKWRCETCQPLSRLQSSRLNHLSCFFLLGILKLLLMCFFIDDSAFYLTTASMHLTFHFSLESW
jgi:hypothetical protein